MLVMTTPVSNDFLQGLMDTVHEQWTINSYSTITITSEFCVNSQFFQRYNTGQLLVTVGKELMMPFLYQTNSIKVLN